MTQSTIEAKEAEKQARKDRSVADEAYEKEQNAGREGKGTRVTVGYTRGRSTQRVVYEAFDESQPATLPAELAEFFDLTKNFGGNDEKTALAWIIDGFNSAQYANASDPISEFMNPAWPDETKKQFKLAVRNYSGAVDCSLETAVELIKPGVELTFQKSLSAAS